MRWYNRGCVQRPTSKNMCVFGSPSNQNQSHNERSVMVFARHFAVFSELCLCSYCHSDSEQLSVQACDFLAKS